MKQSQAGLKRIPQVHPVLLWLRGIRRPWSEFITLRKKFTDLPNCDCVRNKEDEQTRLYYRDGAVYHKRPVDGSECFVAKFTMPVVFESSLHSRVMAGSREPRRGLFSDVGR
ncbi:hypothetical protein K2P96_03045 [Patescibacteria group bacterium]|nr:hypothetical protein [Patescibacteria group bacterium]